MSGPGTAQRLTTAEAAKRMGIHPATLRLYATTGTTVNGRHLRLPSYPAGPKHYRFDPADVDAFVAAIRDARGLATAVTEPPAETPTAAARRIAAANEEARRMIGPGRTKAAAN